ncbi:hypothetical protein B566_EDAN013679 [Ephemera danica]|nr:hypothetical protein B566_EDAN013679 [Ephemera danica]
MSPDKLDCDWLEELAADEEEDSLGDDSDEDSLCSKLCTFTMTQKEFMNQHWYHCHTCKMVDGVGVCSICARVCHKSHDVTYAKYGNFFCDCGAKDDGSCLALVKRSPLSSDDVPMPMQSSSVDHVMIRRTPSSPAPDRSDKNKDERFKQRSALAKQLESCSEALMHHAEASPIINSLLELSCLLLNAVKASCEKNSSVGCHHRAQNALQRLHEDAKQFESTDQLMMPTLGSQEGAFENVRSNYPGDQGQTIRQLLSAHMIRRVAMCCLSSPQGKRQHLAVSHEKGKITVLQLSALLKQADSSKRKLTLTRLASAPIPFTVLSITGNPCNEDFLAVCGLKDCHVLTFSSGGTVVQHLVLHPQLETGNYIIRAIWLPGSQTQLALITADFIKIYDLSKDALSPQYYFLVPSGKIRDATFVFQEAHDPCLLVMSSAGYIYSQGMCEESSAEHGLFYVTNTLEVNHPDIKDVGGLLGGGGVSIYYSHTLQLLFFSFSQGKSFIAPLKSLDSFELPTVFQIQLTNKSSSNGSSKSSSQSQQAQPLCEWSEVPNHPGLVCSVLQASNNPVILMIKPDTVLVQEIKVVPAKAKILDMVAIRHASSSSELRTTLILLCEDGSLRIYMAGQDQTGYWLSPAMQASNPLTSALRTGKKKKTNKNSKQSGASSAPNFPVDFFEHCQLLGDIEYGGNDVLEVYNSEQIKTRLAKQGQYILNTRPAGFTLEINNTDISCVITGIRIFVGSQDPLRSPAYVEILGRSIQLNITSSRWFDYPLTREESLQADRKLSVTFGPSQDPDCVTMVDSILVYGKTKDSFGWPEESEDVAASSANGAAAASTSDNDNNQSSLQQMSVLDKAMAGILEVLDGCFAVFDFSDDKQQQQKSIAINVATNLLTLPTPNSIQFCAKSLLASLHSSKVGYHQFKDQAILKYVTEILSDFDKILSAIDIDSELFYRLVLMTRSIAAARPYNLTKIAETLYKGKDKNFMTHLLDNFWRLHAAKPNNIVLAPVCVPGLTHVETTVHAVVEIINAFTYSDLELVPQAAQLYLKLLLCEDTNISFSAKQALIRVLRPRQRQQPKIPVHCTTPPTTSAPPVSQPSQEEESHAEPVDAIEPIALLDEAGAAGVANPIEALLGAGAFPPLLDIPPESVDETMVELAIALSLQEHDSVANLLSVQQNLQQGLQNLSGQALQSLQALATQAQPGPSHEPGHLSDTTASAGGSDDEGSTAATDGSTLRTSPAEQGWESGGSGADSISCETFERYAVTRSTSHGVSPGSSKCDGNHPPQEHCYNCMQMKEVRLRFTERLLLEKLLAFLPQLKQVGGVQAIPFLQVILILTSDLEGDDQYDRNCLDRLLSALVSELGMRDPVDVNAASECQRTPQLEVHLVMMRFLSVLMSRAKSTSKNSNESDHFVSQTTASTLMDNSVVQYCLGLLKGLLLYWKNQNTNQESASGSGALGGSLLKSSPNLTPPDMSPFFLKLYVKGLGGDVFESYPQLLTEMALRLPYQVLKHADNPLSTINEVFGDEWNFYLCEYMMTNQTPFVRRQVRKLLMFLCGNKDKYRRSRDFHALECHTREIIKVCHEAGLESTTPLNISLAYDQLVELMEHLKSCLEIATSRPNNWQNFCMFSETLVPFLFKASCALDEGVCPTILQLLQNAFGKVQSNKEREKSVESDTNEKDNCSVLVRYITENIPSDIVALFIKTFLLETNSTAVRWQAHDLVQSLHFNSNPTDQETLKDLLWTFWPQLGTYGRKAAQFVDLLGYFSIKSTDNGDKIQDMVDLAVNSLKTQNQILAEHPNTNLYGKLSQFIELDGYYFETRSCLVCNNPEVPLSSIKLSAIKVDSKFTTTTQIVKLVSSHSISKITLRIGDLKRAKMVRSINIFYNNRSVQAVVELKNKPAMWNKAKKVVLTSGQTEVKVDFPLPIVACNLMIEYSDFYENIQASSETLQCPRCGVSVPANPGVCGNCGENVFQCHKCRAINYDEKDPFLCHSCGFCKYAKFEYTLTARPCCAVDPIENDEDRKKTLNSISTMQERADRIYKQLSTIRPNVEVILQSIEEGQGAQEEGGSTGSSNSTHVKQRINLLAQRYCVDCKSSFEELGKISQKVMACRAEIVAYDRKQREDQHVPKRNRFLTTASKDCYGCASSTSEHCLTILKALATISGPKQVLRSSGLINELVEKNLARKSSAMQEQVKHLLCLLAKDQPIATEELCDLLIARIMTALANHKVSSYVSLSVHPEMALLSSLIATEDSCWEQKLKCIVKLYLQACRESKSPSVTEDIVMPCLKILIGLMIPTSPTSQANKDKTVEDLCRILPSEENKVSVHKWLQNDPKYSFKSWLQRMPQKTEKSADSKPSKEETRAKYLTQKYSRRWKQRLGGKHIPKLKLSQHSWLKLILFNKSSRVARQSACKLLETMFQNQVPQRKQELLDLLTSYLGELGDAGETSTEFLALYRTLMQPDGWKRYLALKGTLVKIADLITKEIEQLHQLEDTSLVSDLTDGFALKMLTELLSCFLEHDAIKRLYKGRLVGAVLNGYLALRRLAVQRTRLIDETQEKLFELLEEMTSGTETETKDFMKICIEAVERCEPEDDLTPVFILERLCTIISPEENDIGEFFLTLEKDPQQEDFLQGRMLGNPYSSTEPGLGPLMRDVKNKICQDCELVALLEDDNGMELLVNNKIISLDLPVREVYKKVWMAEGEGEAMRVVYRMRGLLGDATEEFIETLDNKSKQQVNNEEVYKMANITLQRLAGVSNVVRTKPLLQVLLRLLLLCTKKLAHPDLGAIEVLLSTVQRCIQAGKNADPRLTEQILDILETILTIAAAQPLQTFLKLAETFGGPDHIQALLACASPPPGGAAVSASLLQHLGKVLAALTYGHEERMQLLTSHFASVLDFESYDASRTSEDEQKMELFCLLAAGIDRSPAGNTLKDHIHTLGIVHAPPTTPLLLLPDNDDWKDFISRPSLKVILRFLAGLATEHEPTQLEVATSECIAVLHRLEQVSSQEHVGSLSENLLEALRTNPAVAAKVEQVRQQTRAEKKRLAMAMREKQLGALGMKANEKGQVVARSSLLTQLEELGEETGLTCVICREGYRCQPAKVLGIYTYTKRCPIEDVERKQRRTLGYTTVTHFNVVHIDCHMAAVRDEWESAALQNANTKCNGLLPLWGPSVPESAFASCLARHNTYLQECTGHRDIGYGSTVHDLKLLLLRFSHEKPFNEDAGGGGPESNMHLLGYLVHMALYVLNTTRSAQREDKSLTSYLAAGTETWVSSSFIPDGPLYWACMSLLLRPTNRWQQGERLAHLRRILVLSHARHTEKVPDSQPAKPPTRLSDITPQDYAVYKPYLIFFGLVDGMYRLFFKKVGCGGEEQWPSALADFIRHNDEVLLRASDQLLAFYTEELLPCSSFDEFCDVLGLLGEVDDPATFLVDVLRGVGGG